MGKADEEAQQFIIAAHTRVIELFHSLWGVLPARELDDYRVLDVSTYSLSQDFIDEALYGIKNASKPGREIHGFSRTNVDVHTSKGEFTYPVWVGSIELLYQTFEGRVGSMDDEGNIYLDCLAPFEGGINAMHQGGWIIDHNTAYVNAELLDISGPGWTNVVGMTKSEIEESYSKRTNGE